MVIMSDILLIGLAAWRLAYMLVKEDGPFEMFSKLRKLAGIEQIIIKDGDKVDVALTAKNTLAEGLLCVWCVSVWTATFLYVGTLIQPLHAPFMWLSSILAISAVAVIMQEFIAALRGEE